MSTFTDAFDAIPDQASKQELLRMRAFVHEVLPDVTEGTSYGMPAFFYKDKAFLSFVAAKNFLSLYPFSGQIVSDLKEQLKNYDCTKGSIHFSVVNPIPNELLQEIITRRIAMIDAV